MILLLAVFIGLIAAILRAGWGRRSLKPLALRWDWLVVAAVLPQILFFQLPYIHFLIPDWSAAAILVISQVLLLGFVWVNRNKPGFWLLGIGLSLNFLVIILNGGLMPISPEMSAHLFPGAPAGTWMIGQRLDFGKDIVLPVSLTRLWVLSDCLTFPNFISYRVAFSLGDLVIAAGAFWMLWGLGAPDRRTRSLAHVRSDFSAEQSH